jgi:hypothetical protein
MNNVKIYMPERRASSESANNFHPFVEHPRSAKRHRTVSQDAVSPNGVMLRFEAIRAETHQNVYHLLEPY